jgi:hypothetical protein
LTRLARAKPSAVSAPNLAWLWRCRRAIFATYTILHARTAFDDGDTPEDSRRHLFRLWLDAPIRPVHPYMRSRGILPVAGRTPSFDWNSITAVRH